MLSPTTGPTKDTFSTLKECLGEITTKISIPVKDTANPFSHHVLASSNFFNWMQALAPERHKPAMSAKNISMGSRPVERNIDSYAISK